MKGIHYLPFVHLLVRGINMFKNRKDKYLVRMGYV